MSVAAASAKQCCLDEGLMCDYRLFGCFTMCGFFSPLVVLFSCSMNVSLLFSCPLVVLRTKIILPLAVLFAYSQESV